MRNRQKIIFRQISACASSRIFVRTAKTTNFLQRGDFMRAGIYDRPQRSCAARTVSVKPSGFEPHCSCLGTAPARLLVLQWIEPRNWVRRLGPGGEELNCCLGTHRRQPACRPPPVDFAEPDLRPPDYPLWRMQYRDSTSNRKRRRSCQRRCWRRRRRQESEF